MAARTRRHKKKNTNRTTPAVPVKACVHTLEAASRTYSSAVCARSHLHPDNDGAQTAAGTECRPRRLPHNRLQVTSQHRGKALGRALHGWRHCERDHCSGKRAVDPACFSASTPSPRTASATATPSWTVRVRRAAHSAAWQCQQQSSLSCTPASLLGARPLRRGRPHSSSSSSSSSSSLGAGCMTCMA